jgi:hypothetical protein
MMRSHDGGDALRFSRDSALRSHPPRLPLLASNASRALSGSCRLRSEVTTSRTRPVALCHHLGACPSEAEVQASGSRPYGLITLPLSAPGESRCARCSSWVPVRTGGFDEPERSQQMAKSKQADHLCTPLPRRKHSRPWPDRLNARPPMLGCRVRRHERPHLKSAPLPHRASPVA